MNNETKVIKRLENNYVEEYRKVQAQIIPLKLEIEQIRRKMEIDSLQFLHGLDVGDAVEIEYAEGGTVRGRVIRLHPLDTVQIATEFGYLTIHPDNFSMDFRSISLVNIEEEPKVDEELTTDNKLYRCGCGCRFTEHSLLSQFVYVDNVMVKCGAHREHTLTRGVPMKHDESKSETE